MHFLGHPAHSGDALPSCVIMASKTAQSPATRGLAGYTLSPARRAVCTILRYRAIITLCSTDISHQLQSGRHPKTPSARLRSYKKNASPREPSFSFQRRFTSHPRASPASFCVLPPNHGHARRNAYAQFDRVSFRDTSACHSCAACLAGAPGALSLRRSRTTCCRYRETALSGNRGEPLQARRCHWRCRP
ncbi:hypothetical protein LMG28688_05969 [Paraburkholderia caffeinitolerans]|uniref:Uncharacterized protein n=1 Tax=Paraburkholderia caffeinitolerans TaxID=1723730 RepID=A0A6J5GNX8_9BURK|nr:hypothetical protein LMG28688_05969 [Paraburkholderia caffeinitolerans]